jgi:hypothetical protein
MCNCAGLASKRLKFDEGVPFPYPFGTEWESISREHDEMALFALSARNTEYEADHDADALLAMEYSNQQYRCAIHKWITKPDFNFNTDISHTICTVYWSEIDIYDISQSTL